MSTSIQYGLPKANGIRMNAQNTYTATSTYIVDDNGVLVSIPSGKEQPNLPCPFCGGTITKIEQTSTENGAVILKVACSRCMAKASPIFWYPETDRKEAEQQAYAHWNRRTAAPQKDTEPHGQHP